MSLIQLESLPGLGDPRRNLGIMLGTNISEEAARVEAGGDLCNWNDGFCLLMREVSVRKRWLAGLICSNATVAAPL